MSNRRTAIEIEEARSDTTPMIDVVFLMIVFFVCIDFRVLEAKLPAFLPKDQGAGSQVVVPQEQLIVRVTVTEPGTVAFGNGQSADSLDAGTGRPRAVDLAAGAASTRSIDELSLFHGMFYHFVREPVQIGATRHCGDLHFAGAFQTVHAGKHFGDAGADAQCAVVAQNHHAAVTQILDQAFAFIVVLGNTFKVVITHLGECGQCHLRQRQQAVFLRSDGNTVLGMAMHHRVSARAVHVYRAVDGEAGRVYFVRGVGKFVAVNVALDQV
jgi:hypothetical protein